MVTGPGRPGKACSICKKQKVGRYVARERDRVAEDVSDLTTHAAMITMLFKFENERIKPESHLEEVSLLLVLQGFWRLQLHQIPTT
ncbi:hypothetical protein ACHAQI_001694 [Fusarium lateritium]